MVEQLRDTNALTPTTPTYVARLAVVGGGLFPAESARFRSQKRSEFLIIFSAVCWKRGL